MIVGCDDIFKFLINNPIINIKFDKYDNIISFISIGGESSSLYSYHTFQYDHNNRLNESNFYYLSSSSEVKYV